MGNDDISAPSTRIAVPLNDEEVAAIEGWRRANSVDSREDALRQLVRLGLLSEIGRIYRESGPGEDR